MTGTKKIDKCRICGSTDLVCVLDLGEQALTGVFPRTRDREVTVGPVGWSSATAPDAAAASCSSSTSYDVAEMYGDNYGYRSGLNRSMVATWQAKVQRISAWRRCSPATSSSTSAATTRTTLQRLPEPRADAASASTRPARSSRVTTRRRHADPGLLLGAEPSASGSATRKAKIVTSFAMFYDLEAPHRVHARRSTRSSPTTASGCSSRATCRRCSTNAYDTVCHEHLEYYALRQIQWMAERVGLQHRRRRVQRHQRRQLRGDGAEVGARPLSPNPRRRRDPGARGSAGAGHAGAVPSVSQDGSTTLARRLLAFLPGQGRGQDGLRLLAHRPRATWCCSSAASPSRTCSGHRRGQRGQVRGVHAGHAAADRAPSEDLLDQQPDYLLVLPWHFRSVLRVQPESRRSHPAVPAAGARGGDGAGLITGLITGLVAVSGAGRRSWSPEAPSTARWHHRGAAGRPRDSGPCSRARARSRSCARSPRHSGSGRRSR